MTATTFVTPYIKPLGLSLCDLREDKRRAALALVKYHAELAAESGYLGFGIPSGNDPGDEKRADAMKAMTESMEELAEFTAKLSLNLMIEPLDRYAYKKQLIGPIGETCEWFAPIRAKYPNVFIHWDSAHEALGGADLMESLEIAKPFLGQFHLCDAITDPTHPCFGDLHMDCAMAPDWTTEGFLTPEVGAEIVRKVASFDPPAGMEKVYVSVEICGHPGNNLWFKEKISRELLVKSFETAGISLNRT